MAAGIKVNTIAFKNQIMKSLTPTTYEGFRHIAAKTACWGIKGELALIMGVLNFGDPAHTVPNHKKTSPTRKNLESALAAFGGKNDSAIPPRPWLSRSTEGVYQVKLNDYIRENTGALIASVVTQGGTEFKSTSKRKGRALNPDDFIKGLAEVGKKNAQQSWEKANFKENAPMTLAHKSDPRPLHGTGRMNESVIEAWTE